MANSSPPLLPLLVLPAPIKLKSRRSPPPGMLIGPSNPGKARQVERLGPRFDILRAALEQKKAALLVSPESTTPEQVLVFETNGPMTEFVEAVANTPGMQWLAEGILEDLEQDADYRLKDEPDKKISARVYMIMANQTAINQLLSLWRAWNVPRPRFEPEMRPWLKIFARLRDIRKWSVQDRIFETNVLEDWTFRLQEFPDRRIPVEIQLWFRSPSTRFEAQKRISLLVEQSGGHILQASVIEEIAYHAVLVDLPSSSIEAIVQDSSVGLVTAEDVQLFRPCPQHIEDWVVSDDTDPLTEDDVSEVIVDHKTVKRPKVAVLDGLPIENHTSLFGRLRVDDPDAWSQTYEIGNRNHCTAMTSLVLNGDMSNSEPIDEVLYVRPILRPNLDNRESAPENLLWVDLIHRAIKRIFEGEGTEPAAAPDVQVINLSVGNLYQTFVNTISPLARLLDWLAWKYQVLIIVSAGNHTKTIELAEGEIPNLEEEVIKALAAGHRNRRLVAPAEGINVLTVGALNSDESGSFTAIHEQTALFSSSNMPAPYSALGRGFRLSVKPDLFAPGGRAIYNKRLAVGNRNIFDLIRLGARGPGIKHAVPGKQGKLNELGFSIGTSNAAALTSRAALKSIPSIEDLKANAATGNLTSIPTSLILKSLLVHCSSWGEAAEALFTKVLRTERNRSNIRDLLSAYMGYGALDPSRMLSCVAQRATAIGGGLIADKEVWKHSIPLPQGLNAYRDWRRLTITLAWYSPISTTNRKYKCASLYVKAPIGDLTPLRLAGTDVHLIAGTRGTVQHMILEKQNAVIDTTSADSIEVEVSCVFDAPCDHETIPYAITVSLEVGQNVNIAIYAEVKVGLVTRVRI